MKSKGQFILFSLDEFDDFLRNKEFDRTVRRIQNHHTLKPDYADFTGDNHFALLEGMKKFHVRERGFSDIAQQITIFPDGTVATCRTFEKAPACIMGANTAAVCIENLGNFDKGRDAMTGAQRSAVVRVNALLCREFRLPVNTDTILYHHWFDLVTGKRRNGKGTTKSCPGTAFFGGNTVEACEANLLPLVRAELRRLAGAPAEEPSVAVFKVVSPDGVLAVRGAPRVSGPKLTDLPNGTRVQIFEARGLWRRIDEDEQKWVSSRFLAPA